MLDQLFGNASVETILFFLLINGRGYAGKLARHFNLPLTPIQQGFQKLELLGIVESYVEGKVRYYQFNAACPILNELEALLRKAYTLLPAPKKKEYYDPEFKQKSVDCSVKTKENLKLKPHNGSGLVIRVWETLSIISKLSFSAASQNGSNSGWNGVGRGEVLCQKQNDHVIVFAENGSWTSREGKEFTFTNTFRWTLDRFQNLITLEHLRFGELNPVFLFHLAQTAEEILESVNSHVCNEDTYLGQVRCLDKFVKLNWRIIGPKKNEEIDYLYT